MTETEQYLYDMYGTLNLNTEQLAKILGYSGGRGVLEAYQRRTLPVPTFMVGRFRMADLRDVAAYLDKQKEGAAAAAGAEARRSP